MHFLQSFEKIRYIMLLGKTETPSVVLGSVELGTVGLVSDIPGKRTLPETPIEF